MEFDKLKLEREQVDEAISNFAIDDETYESVSKNVETVHRIIRDDAKLESDQEELRERRRIDEMQIRYTHEENMAKIEAMHKEANAKLIVAGLGTASAVTVALITVYSERTGIIVSKALQIAGSIGKKVI